MKFEDGYIYGRFVGIYRIVNNVNGKMYVGQTLDSFHRRYISHKYDCSHNMRRNKLYNSMRKYGWDNFSFEILDFCDNPDRIDDLERFYIKRFDTIQNGFNLDSGGNQNKHHSEETKRKSGA